MDREQNFMKWLIWSLAAFFYLYEYFLRVSPSVMISELMGTFHVNATIIGTMSAFYLYSYASMQLPVGLLMDRFGSRKLLTLAAFVCGLGGLFFGFSQEIWTAGLGRLFMGFGSAFAFVAMIYVCSHWFPTKRLALLVGLANSLGMLGAVAGQGPLSLMVRIFGWRDTSIYGFGIIGILLAIIIFVFVRNDPPNIQEHQKRTESVKELLRGFKDVFLNFFTWVNALGALLFYLTTSVFAGLWGIPFLHVAHKMDINTASFATSMIFVGWLVGGPLVGIISDKLRSRKLVILVSIVFTFILLCPVIYTQGMHPYPIFILLFLVGLFSSAELLSFSLAIELNPRLAKASSVALTNCLIAFAGSGLQPLVGYLLDTVWDGHRIKGIAIYTVDNYLYAMSVFPITLILAFFVYLFVKEKKHQSHIHITNN